MIASFWLGLASLAIGAVVYAISTGFHLGKQSQRITALEQTIGDRSGMNETVIELRVKMEHAETQLSKISATLEGVNRQLGNIAMGRIGLSGELK